MENILIIKHGALGDIVLSVGTVRYLREQHPDARFTMLTMKPFVGLMQQTGVFDDFIVDNREPMLRLGVTWRILKAIRDGHFSTIYDLQGRDRTATYRRLLRRLMPVGSRYDWYNYRNGIVYHTERRCALLPARETAERGEWPQPVSDLRFLHGKGEHFDMLPERFVMLIPGCSPQHTYKRWPVANYRELVARLAVRGVSAVVIGTKAEAAEVNAICAGNPTAVNMLGLTGLFDVPQIALRALATVGNDTGPSHMASLTGAFTIALYDHKTRFSVLRGPNSRCFVSDGPITDITPDDVWAALEPHLAEA